MTEPHFIRNYRSLWPGLLLFRSQTDKEMKWEEDPPDCKEVAAEKDNCDSDWESEVLGAVFHESVSDCVDKYFISELKTLIVQIFYDVLHLTLFFTDHENVANKEHNVHNGIKSQDDHGDLV